MQTIKKHLKFIIGVGVLILTLIVFSCTMRSTGALENGKLKDWRNAPTERRISAAQTLVASSDTDFNVLVGCVDKMATLPDSGEMAVRDAVSLCYTGMKLKQNL